MKEIERLNMMLNRRDLLKAGALGACALCLTAVSGCFPADDEHDPGGEPDPLPAGAEKGLIRAGEAAWFSTMNNLKVRCELCPHLCELTEGERGICRVRENRDGRLKSLVFGNPALVQEDPVERKPFFHVLPGSRALSISTAGCNLACQFCEVWDMALVNPEEVYAYDMAPQNVVEHALASGVRSVSYAFGEPVVFYEYVMAVAEKAREAGLLNLMHTAGYIREEPLRELRGSLDAVNFDLKGFNADFYRRYVGGEMTTVLKSLKLLRESGVHIEITTILIPTLNDDMETIAEMCKWIAAEIGADVPLHFARFYPLYKLSALPRTPASTLEEARQTALRAGLRYVYVSRVTGHEGENTFCPRCGEKIIARVGFVVERTDMVDGACRYCNETIPGRWA